MRFSPCRSLYSRIKNLKAEFYFLMPILAVFLGIVIRIFYEDHNPPHFHAEYGGYEVLIEIKTGKIVVGNLPSRPMKLVMEWMSKHKHEIEKAWLDAKELRKPDKIKPLE